MIPRHLARTPAGEYYRRSWFTLEYWKLGFEHVKFEMPIGCPHGDTSYVLEGANLEFREEVWSGDKCICELLENRWLFKGIRLDAITKGVNINKEKAQALSPEATTKFSQKMRRSQQRRWERVVRKIRKERGECGVPRASEEGVSRTSQLSHQLINIADESNSMRNENWVLYLKM